MKDYNFEFQKKFDFNKRKLEASRIREKYPNRIPIILEKDTGCKSIQDIDKKIPSSKRSYYGTVSIRGS